VADGEAAAGDSRLRLVRAAELSGATAQTSGMVRAAAISGDLVGAQSLWMGRTVLTAGASSGDHHHGESETGIFVVSGSVAALGLTLLRSKLRRLMHGRDT